MFLGEPLDPLQAVEQAPLGAEDGDRVALLVDLPVERP